MTREPTAIISAIGALISAGIKLLVILQVVDWTAEQTAAISLFADAALTVATVLFIRSQVTPVAQPSLPAGSTVDVKGVGSVTMPDAA